jgi:Ca2+-binding RTX toxin-like protein
VRGGAGDDRLMPAWPFDQTLDGGPGHDVVKFDGAGKPLRIDLARGFARGGDTAYSLRRVESVTGGRHDDVMLGNAGPNSLEGSRGDDRIRGRGGDDYVQGNDGDDYGHGGAGEDWCIAEVADACEPPAYEEESP